MKKNLRKEEPIRKSLNRIVKKKGGVGQEGDVGSEKTTPDTSLKCLTRFTMEIKWKKIPMKVILRT